MSDPYAKGMLRVHPYAKKKDVVGELVAILEGKLENRGLQLIKPISRALAEDEIHEIIVTDETDAGPGKQVNRIAYLAFFEVKGGGVIVAGDPVFLKGKLLGHIAGFDETHMPNHINIVIKSEERQSGVSIGAEIGQQLLIKSPD
ncbi:hypothetical protein HM1_2744 [Heliomicrobium modesticaldum Ice1]|uniref:DUF6917 domain-containing protein n=1 Tax=Heliobacterium modesticaldum (strain ATCC 51547 / Ice1) TaxID=498761 RepID=B0TC00_HELMI|nr:hypothetical protein [Heliomicrobium modesticaldum]ABZ85273.1 hypothetical protein HM1_2744 [Heliomicrobium modesticaldum Ice1]